MPNTLVPLLGDHLTRSMSSLREVDKDDTLVLMAEVLDEATYVKHHKKKIALVFSAMRHFAEQLTKEGWRVEYVRLDAPDNRGSLTAEIERAVEAYSIRRVVVTEPGEWRLLLAFQALRSAMGIRFDILDDDRYVASHAEFEDFAANRRTLRMEDFYRRMRQKTGLLMTDTGEPAGGRWNLDVENRKPFTGQIRVEGPLHFEPDDITDDVLALVDARFPDHFGELAPFWFAVDDASAERALDHFIDVALPHFGDYQDAMREGEPFLFHAVISAYMNLGLLAPMEACRRAERAYIEGHAPLNAVEGFIRQIIGWREFVRGIYWHAGPEYSERNHFGHRRPLPAFYWTGDTEMACISNVVAQTKAEAYAHHIQRLMITGNFAVLAGINPTEVHEWYLSVYADAFEWVELPNTIGMSQFADGGLLASKPYVSGGNYINKMSNYCASCRYDVKTKHGEGACPFNFLYWHFLDRHADKLRRNPRLATAYRNWDRMSNDVRGKYLESAGNFLEVLS